MVDKVIGMNGKPFDARDFNDENREAVEAMVFDVADAIDSGDVVPRAIAFMVMEEDGQPKFWYGGKETDAFLIYGGIEALKNTFWETVLCGELGD